MLFSLPNKLLLPSRFSDFFTPLFFPFLTIADFIEEID